MSLSLVFDATGGLALFMLAMAMMTEGLKVFGGAGLRHMLEHWTSSPLRGLASGALVTAIVQSSSAVTVAVIGFVNAGVLSLHQAIGVVMGANVGTTMTGWLVGLTGVGLPADLLAMPMLAIGVALRLGAGSGRWHGLGNALAGFGLFFLGLDMLKSGFSGLAEAFDLGSGGAGPLTWLGIGVAATVLTQSSSAAIAIVLTATAQGLVGLEDGAAAVIGANIGTTSTALVAVLGATAAARRVAIAHLGFNVVTGIIAFALLPVLVPLLAGLEHGQGGAAVLLALFHTIFNLAGAALLLPFAGAASRMLGRLFRSAGDDIARMHFLDGNVARTPDLAVRAMLSELQRLRQEAGIQARIALDEPGTGSARLRQTADALTTATRTVAEFATRLGMTAMTRQASEQIPAALRCARYLASAAGHMIDARTVSVGAAREHDHPVQTLLGEVIAAAGAVAVAAGPAAAEAAGERFEAAYEAAKSGLLIAAAGHRIDIDRVEGLLDSLSGTRRLAGQLLRADRLLARMAGADAAEAGEPPAPQPDAPPSVPE
ncbi:MAG: Na/Pi symporter [Pseudomonadota bacterium]|nr:Na/Pi symporter [Pseudomonadota bacterium]